VRIARPLNLCIEKDVSLKACVHCGGCALGYEYRFGFMARIESDEKL